MYSVGVDYIRIVLYGLFGFEKFVVLFFGGLCFFWVFLVFIFIYIYCLFGAAAIAVGLHLDSFRSQK